MHILVLDPHLDVALPLAGDLRKRGYAVDVALCAEEGTELLTAETNDLLIVDVDLPDVDGLEVVEQTRRAYSSLLILILTARWTPEDRVAGLNLGADDYVVKPFHFEELVARIEALLRREAMRHQPILTCGELTLDPVRRIFRCGEKYLNLSGKQFGILEYLMRRPGEVVTHGELLDHVWDSQVNPITNVLAVHINSLRKVLNDSAKEPRYIKTVTGEGYQLMASPHDDE